jgi:hypothetical protein
MEQTMTEEQIEQTAWKMLDTKCGRVALACANHLENPYGSPAFKERGRILRLARGDVRSTWVSEVEVDGKCYSITVSQVRD